MPEILYDFHSHILPGMDDGYQDVDSAIKALELSYAQGVRYMVATPHYYHQEPIDAFLLRRQKAMDRLQEAMDRHGGPFPQICLGAEVHYYPNIKLEENLRKLCLGNSAYMLLELPFLTWDMDVVREVQTICCAGEVTPILAHIERYIPLQERYIAQQMLSLDVLLQMNAEFILARRTRRSAKKMLRNQPPYLFGTDCHNLEDRQPLLRPALERLKGGAMAAAVDDSLHLSQELWEQVIG